MSPEMRAKNTFNFNTLVLLNAQTLSDTDTLLATSVGNFD